MEGSTLHLAILRDLRRVNSHLAAVAYDVLDLVDPSPSLEPPSDSGEPPSGPGDPPILEAGETLTRS
jgi:hypothetical protein